jgi:uncharacterized membrane protein YdjX (TVP38/TMEM64 family)
LRKAGHAGAVVVWLAAGLVLIGAAFGWFLLPLREWAEEFNAWIPSIGAWGPVTFLFAYVVAVVALVPASALTLAAGLTFGFWAFPLVLLAATIGAAAAFLISRHIISGRMRRLLEDLPRAKAIYHAVGSGGWKMVWLLRLSPVMPFSVMNYVLGATELGFWPYICATLVGIMPALALYVYLGALGKATIDGAAGGTLRWLLLVMGLIATGAAILYVARRARAELRKAGLDSA